MSGAPSIVEREAAQAIDETTLIANEPVTVVLSTGGFVRAAKGHEIDPHSLSYKSGDGFQSMARGRSLQAGDVHRQHGAHLLAAGALAAFGARARASRCRAASIRRMARSSPAS